MSTEQDKTPKSPGEDYFYTPPDWLHEHGHSHERIQETRAKRAAKEAENK
jgi:hypothetical protein